MENERGNVIVAIFFLLFPLIVATGITGLLGGALSGYYPDIKFMDGFWYMNLIGGTGWILQLVLATLFLKGDDRGDYIGFLLTVVLSSGLMIIVPYIIVDLLIPDLPVWVPVTAIILSFIVMGYRHFKKVAFMELSQVWTLLWILSLLGTSTLWTLMLVY